MSSQTSLGLYDTDNRLHHHFELLLETFLQHITDAPSQAKQ